MATDIILEYGVSFGPGDGSDVFEWETTVDGQAEKDYLEAKKLRKSFYNYPSLRKFLDEAYDEIADSECDNLCDAEDPLALECMGRQEVDPDEINELVKKGDHHALEFFGLTGASEKELKSWDANDLIDLPMVCDFEEDFTPENPIGNGYSLLLDFQETPKEDKLDEEEATATIGILLDEANGDYSTVEDYINRCCCIYSGDNLRELADKIAGQKGINYRFSEEN